jgi:signal transduction histidine kinase
MLEQLARCIESTHGMCCTLKADDDFRIDAPDIAINLYRITQEALNNAIRHGHAKNIRIGLQRTPSRARLEISDDGSGLPPHETGPQGGGLGMHTMRHRAALIGASLQIGAADGGGTRLVIDLPLSEESGPDALQRKP